MKVAIYGAGGYGQYIYHEIKNNIHAKLSVAFWIDNLWKKKNNLMIDPEVCELPVCSEERFFLEHKYNEIDGIVVAIDDRRTAEQIVLSLLLHGYDSIYLALPQGFLPKIPILDDEGNLGPCVKYYKEIKPSFQAGEIVNFLVTDYCNLRCKRCGNFSNLAKENNCLNLNEFESYLIQLRKKINVVPRIQLLGGEPLLNPQLNQYIFLTRKYFPETWIDIVTNGLLIPQMGQKLIDAMISCNVHYFISQYPPTRRQLDKIIAFLEEKGISYFITEPILQFEKPLTLKHQTGKEAYQKRDLTDCMCHTIKNGRMGCPLLMTLYDNKDYFELYITEEEFENSSIDLMSSSVNGWDIIKYCRRPAPLCRFCNPDRENVAWETGQPHKEEWFSD